MDRREFLTIGGATAAAAALAKAGVAAPNAAQAPAMMGWKNHLDAYSRTLHWLRTPGEVAQACREIGNTTIDLTVRTYPGHVQPDKVKTDLPTFVNGLKREGITVTKIGMDVNDASTPYVEDMLAAAASLGIHHTWWRGVGFDWSLGYAKMLDAAKMRTEPLAKLLAKYNFKACYHPGGGFTEVIDLCRAFDPRNISIDYDTGNFGQFNQGTLASQIRIGGPYIGSFVFKDFVIDHLSPQQQAGANAVGGRGPAGGAAPAARGAAPAGRVGGGARGAGPAGAAGAGRGGVPATGTPADASTGRAAGAGGRGGGGGSPNGWSSRQVPVGTGVLNLAVICQALKDINFQGPIECQPEWPELGGPNQGLEQLSIPREEVIRMLRRDYLTVSAPLAAAGVI